MVIHCLATAAPAKAQRLREILALHTTDQALIRVCLPLVSVVRVAVLHFALIHLTWTAKEAVDIIKSTESITYAKNMARKLISDAWKDITPIFFFFLLSAIRS
jgi:hypothetical protein